MRFQRYLPADDRQHCFQFCIVGGHFADVHLLLPAAAVDLIPACLTACLPQLFIVDDRLLQHFPQFCRHGHARIDAFFLITVLRILSECNFHGCFFPDNHVVHAVSIRFDDAEGSSDHIGASRSCRHAGNASLPCHAESLILRVDRIYRRELRCHRIAKFIEVLPRKTDRITVEPQMAVCIHKPGIDIDPHRINDSRFIDDFALQHRRNLFYFSVLNQNIRHKCLLVDGIVDRSLF